MGTSVFISHSSNDDAATAEVRDAVYQALQQAGCTPLLDKQRLEPGDAWRSKLFTWMAICDGAVLLLNADALASEWVRTEGIILAWRSALDRRVKVVPVLLGTSVDDVRDAGFRPVALDELQMVQGAKESPATLAARVAAAFASHPPIAAHKDPLALWVKMVASLLAGNELLEVAATLLNIDPADRAIGTLELHHIVAYALLHARAPELEGAIKQLATPMSPEQGRRLGALVSPSLMPVATARGLLGIANGESGACRVAALRSTLARTADRLVRRAMCCHPQVEVIAQPSIEGAGEFDGDDLLDRYRTDILVRYGVADLSQLDEGVVHGYAEAGNRMFVVLEDKALDAAVLSPLHDDFSDVVFLCSADAPRLQESSLNIGPGRVAEIEPALDAVGETQRWAIANRLEGVSP